MNENISKIIALIIFITVISKFMYLMKLVIKDIITNFITIKKYYKY